MSQPALIDFQRPPAQGDTQEAGPPTLIKEMTHSLAKNMEALSRLQCLLSHM